MAAERDIHVILVSEIEKYPLLYNYNIPEYSRKDPTEKAWTEIGKKTSLTVNDCKEKWRNIRSTFLRSIKSLPSGSKIKKPYYLSEHLTFILPYVKPLNNSCNRGNTPSAPETERSPIDAEAVGQENEQVHEEHVHEEQDHEEQVPNINPIDSQHFFQQTALPLQSTSSATAAPTSQIHGVRRRKFPASEVDVAMINFLKKKTEKKREPTESQKEKQMNHFFLSLLPEFSDMTNQQIRTFKIKVLQLIDNIKQTNQSSSSGTNS
ncbi:hypothetical protein JTB14_019972 [Gonioctena quinquepunctata]|nr:hypothetical protein JTB14_019972 [Gonioctena quinquepunctata]